MRTRRGKYNAVRTTVDGHTFASKKEAARYQELRLLEKAGEIWDLELQPRFPLCVPSTSGMVFRALKAMSQGNMFKIGEYRGDFRYMEKGSDVPIVEDVKSPPTRTPLYRWKIKHLAAQYGLIVREV